MIEITKSNLLKASHFVFNYTTSALVLSIQ